ncbi:YkvI family membrane protein [Oceanobacillus chungangensis]|uniref:Membrane protein YkvI n=1 Tax=Oceanobacillus chungangensis TaxID=1229152 RepID=A0A3D8PM85_9BACI|nr:hypothetical protein [Oceanobacillus chungangensis]RDW16782.1 hypothetical protein CWR45_14260 [Oceanobacillus chungangensis]
MWRAGFKWMSLIIGATIGAGYTSGREIWEFFGHGSGLAILLVSIFFTIGCMVIMNISYSRKSTHYIPVLKDIVGPRLTGFYDVMILIYLFTITIVMIAGGGATGQAFNVPNWLGIGIMVTALILLFINGVNGLLSMNQVIVPILIIGLLLVLVDFMVDQNLTLFSHIHEQDNWISAFPFTALNILPIIAVIGAIGNKINSKQEIIIASVSSGVILGVISYIYNNSLIQIEQAIILYEIPLFAILKHYPAIVFIIMSILLWLAIFKTAAAGILGIVSRIQEYFKLSFVSIVILLLVVMIPLTSIGFSTLISFTYPIYGILNLYVLTRLLLYPIWNNADRHK